MLFDMIDINSKGTIEFGEFAEFIVNRASSLNKYSATFQSDAIQPYSLSSIKSPLKIFESCSKSIYIEEIDKILILEDRSVFIKFLTPHVKITQNGKVGETLKNVELVQPQDSKYNDDYKNELIRKKAEKIEIKRMNKKVKIKKGILVDELFSFETHKSEKQKHYEESELRTKALQMKYGKGPGSKKSVLALCLLISIYS